MTKSLIVFDGIDRAGKTTHLKLITKWLQEIHYPFMLVREPGGTPLAEKIRKIFLQEAHALDPTLQLLLLSCARFDLTKMLSKHEGLILCDRFTDSTYAYQGQFLEKKLIDDLIKLSTHVQPDFIFLFLNTYGKNINEMDALALKHRTGIIEKFRERAALRPEKYFIVPHAHINRQQELIKQKLTSLLGIKP